MTSSKSTKIYEINRPRGNLFCCKTCGTEITQPYNRFLLGKDMNRFKNKGGKRK